MSKTFRAILSEQDTEYTYHIKSTRHLHDDEIFYNLQLGLLGYDLRSMERMSYNPLAASEPMFPPSTDEPGVSTVYHVKVVLGTDVPNEILRQKVAYFTSIHWKWVVVHRDGEKMEDAVTVGMDDETKGEYKTLAQYAKNWDGTPDDGDVDSDAQGLVGANRIDSFMKELESDKKDREKEIKARNVTPKLEEAFITTHIGMNDALGHNPRKGYYLIERFKVDPAIMHISGPYKDQPISHDFVPSLDKKGCGTFEVLSEDRVKLVGHDREFRYTSPLRERRIRNFEVVVQDQDTALKYTVIAKAVTETDARAKAVRMVARQQKLDANKLIAVEPEAV